MHFDPVDIVKYTDALTAPCVIAVNHGIYDCLAQRLQRVVWQVNALPSLDSSLDGNVLGEKCLSLIDEFLDGPGNDLAIGIPAYPQCIAIQDAHYFALENVQLWVIAKKEEASVGRDNFPLHDPGAFQPNQKLFYILEPSEAPTSR